MSESTPKATRLAFRDVQIGQTLEIERSFTAEDVQRFAAVSGDWSPLHNIVFQVTTGIPPARMADYVAAKYALYGRSKALAVEWAVDGIRVRTVSPELTRTELTEHYHDRVFKMEATRVPLGRLADPDDVANTVAFLLGDESAFLTGVNVPVSGAR